MLWLMLACSTPEPPPPDILLVVLDTTRADHLQTYGYARDTSYQLNAIAQAGVVFEDATVSGPWTWPGHAELFTGEPPWVSAAHYAADSDSEVALQSMRTDLPTLAEQLAAAGYRTESHATNWLLDPELGLTRGFETAFRHESDAATVRAAAQAMQREDDRPLFLFVNLASAHAPYYLVDGVPWSDAHRSTVMQVADGALGHMRVDIEGAVGIDPGQKCANGYRCDLDWTAGRTEITPDELTVIADLYDANLVQADNALKAVISSWTSGRSGVVAVTSDHGELLGEHGMLQHRLITVPELLHVPMVVVGPGFEAKTRSSVPVQLQDLNAALLRAAGVETSEWTLQDALAGTPRPEPIQAAAWPDPRVKDVPLVSAPWGYVREGDQAVAVSGERVLQFGAEPASDALIDAARALPSKASASEMLSDEAMKQLEAMGYL